MPYPRGGGAKAYRAVLMVDAFTPAANEGFLRHDSQSLGRDTELLRVPPHKRMLEGINSIIQNVKRRARGFRNNEYFTTMIYLNCGALDIDAVTARA